MNVEDRRDFQKAALSVAAAGTVAVASKTATAGETVEATAPAIGKPIMSWPFTIPHVFNPLIQPEETTMLKKKRSGWGRPSHHLFRQGCRKGR